MASQPGNFNVQEFADAGVPLVGGRLYTYSFGTTTQKDAYTDAAGTIPQTYTSDGAGGQYIALNSRGELPAPLYLADGAYDLALKRADGSTVWTRRAEGLASNLAVSTGASLIGFLQAGAGAVAQTVQHKMREQPSTPYDCGAVGDGTTDDTAKVQAWATNGVKNKSWGSGRFLIKAEIVFEADAQVTGNGEESVVVIDPAFVGSYPIQNTPGTLTLITGPSAAMTRGDSSLTFAAAPALAADDVFILYNPTDSSWSGFRTYYREGEFCEVASVVGSVVGLKNALYDSYVAAAMSCYKMSPDRSCFENFVIEGATSLGLIKVSLGMNNRVKVRATNANDSCVQFDRCIYPSIGDGTDLYNAGGGANDYALVFSNCQHGRTPDSFHAYARRHAVTCGGTDVVGAVPCRDVLVRGVLKNDINSGVPSANFHGNCDDCHFLDITARAVNLAGRNTSVRGGKLTHVLNGTIAAIGEVKGGLIGLFGVRLSTTVNPQPSPTSQAIIDFGGNSNVVTASTDEDLDIQVHGCKLRGRNLSSLTSVLIFANRGSAARVNFSVQDLALDVDALGFILHTQLVSGTAASASCIVDGISGAPAGCALAAHVASGYETFPQRMQRQAGILAGVTTATTSVIAAPITLPMSYPKVPTATAGVRGVGGAALGTLGGQADVSARSFQATATTARPMIAAPAAFTASAAFEFTWATELREC